jgi:hypothetical protein
LKKNFADVNVISQSDLDLNRPDSETGIMPLRKTDFRRREGCGSGLFVRLRPVELGPGGENLLVRHTPEIAGRGQLRERQMIHLGSNSHGFTLLHNRAEIRDGVVITPPNVKRHDEGVASAAFSE